MSALPAPIDFSRRGACPALSAPMQTGDGLLVRLNPLTAGLAPQTLEALCAAAARHGNGIVEVTARGGFQIRGLTKTSAPRLAAEVDTLGIAVATGVPVQIAPLAALDPTEAADARPLAKTIREGIDARGLNGKLGAKVSVVIDGGGRSGLDRVAADVRLTAMGADTWLLATGGDAATANPLAVLTAEHAGQVALELLEAIAAQGLKARGRDLSEHIGWQLRSTLPPSGLPAISPSRGEITLLDADAETTSNRGRRSNESLISPPEGEMAGRPEGGNAWESPSAEGSFDLLPLTDNRHALPLALPFGSVEAATLIALMDAATKEGIEEISLAPSRRLLALCPSPDAAMQLRQCAKALGFVVADDDARAHIEACAGRPACASAHLETRALAQAAAQTFGVLLDGTLSLHISGCAKGCARQAPAAITLVGGEKGAGCVVAGTARDTPLAYTPLKGAASGLGRIAALLRRHRDGRSSAETLTGIDAEKIAAAFGNGNA